MPNAICHSSLFISFLQLLQLLSSPSLFYLSYPSYKLFLSVSYFITYSGSSFLIRYCFLSKSTFCASLHLISSLRHSTIFTTVPLLPHTPLICHIYYRLSLPFLLPFLLPSAFTSSSLFLFHFHHQPVSLPPLQSFSIPSCLIFHHFHCPCSSPYPKFLRLRDYLQDTHARPSPDVIWCFMTPQRDVMCEQVWEANALPPRSPFLLCVFFLPVSSAA